jgi:hypothetical protein
VSLNRAVWEVLEGFDHGFSATLLPFLFFGIAALAPWFRRSPATA